MQNSTDSVNCFDAVIHLASVSIRVADIKICSHDSARFASASCQHAVVAEDSISTLVP